MKPAEQQIHLKVVALLSLAKVAIHLFTAEGYGYFRDEFYYIACAKHLAAGYVDHPPLSVFLLALNRALFGDSLIALRLLPALAGGATVFVTGLFTQKLGGNRFAQALACIAVIIAPEYLALNHFYSMNAFDLLFWVLAAYLLFKSLQAPTIGNWAALGIVVGLALMNKISMLWFGAGIFVGLLLTKNRRLFATPGPWIAASLAAFMFLPYVLWQTQNDWATLEFIRNATSEKMAATEPLEFLTNQILNLHPLTFPIWISGLVYALVGKRREKLAVFSLAYLTVAAILILNAKSRSGYLAPAYPMLFAFGSVAIGEWLNRKNILQSAIIIVLLLGGAVTAPLALPALPVETYIGYAKRLGVEPSTEEKKEVAELPQFYADMFGWDAITAQVAEVYQSLPAEDRKRCRILTSNYGEAGAMELLGNQHGLPPEIVISSHNNYWLWGHKDFDGEVMIILGGGEQRKREYFADVRSAGVTKCRFCMPYENNRTIFVCRNLKLPVQNFWEAIKHYD